MKEIATNIFWIETSAELVEFCQKLAHAKVLALDTEFMRTHTFWPEPCLVQVGNGDCSALIDLKVKNLDWTPFIALMEDHSITKILHSGRQDMEIFYRLWKIFPFPLFDTQVAATMCGHDDNISYENLVQHTLGIALDKAQQFSNWNRRPLSHRQLLYAAADVVHLPALYANLKERIGPRYDWVQEDLQHLYDPHLYAPLPQKAWQRFKSRQPQSLKFTKVMHRLCAWREELAQRKDISRQHVLKDKILLELAQRQPASLEELKAIPLATEIAARYYETILELIQTALTNDLAEDLAERPARHRRIKEEDVEALKTLAAEIATTQDIPLRVLATRRDLEALATHDPKAQSLPRCLQGWRRDIFGLPALKLLKDLKAATKEAKRLAAEEAAG